MRPLVDFRVLELLAARFCHELVSPIGAVNNGVELLAEEDPEFVKEAVKLIGQSGRTAGQRLQFYRFAYGSASGGGSAEPRDLVLGLLDGAKTRLEWHSEAAALPREWQRLACNMVVLANEALPRGGIVTVGVRPEGGKAGAGSSVMVAGAGESVNLTAEMQAALSRSVAVEDLSSRSVQAYFTATLGEQLGAKVEVATATARNFIFAASTP
jgi:histidine phosphotransferase ChpT